MKCALVFTLALVAGSFMAMTDDAASAAGADDAAPSVRVMSFNIRYGAANDGENHWDKRKDFVVETIKAFEPDLLGTQETLDFQRDYLAQKLDGYASFGVGRDDGTDKGEMTAVLYRTARFEKLDGGHFWLSETPDVPGSKSWDTSLTRMVSWLKLRDRKAPDRPALYFFNTHFDHRGQQARIESAKLIREKIKAIAGDAPVILTGDFNAGEGSGPYQALFGEAEDRVALVDTYRALHAKPGDQEGTFNGFRPDATGGARIDWIAVTKHWTIKSAAIDHTAKDGRVPSDHFPVTAVVAPNGR